MDSTTITAFLTHYLGPDWGVLAYSLLTVAVPVIYRMLISWANNRPTTWYWNSLTKKFVLKRTDKMIAAMFGRGTADCKARYEDNLPDEAKEELKKRLTKKYPLLQIPVPGEKNEKN